MNYISFRAMMSSITALLVALVAGKKIIAWLQKKQIGETIRDLGLEGQMAKKGTPTMGGIIIILSILAGTLLFCRLDNIYTILLTVTALWLGGLGFADDYIKVFKHNKEGLSEKAKLLGQFVLALGIGLAICFVPQFWGGETKEIVTTIPFVKAHEFNYAWLIPFKGQFGMYCTWVLYVLVIIFVILACSNGTNLTDGLDGLAAGTSAIVGIVIGIFGWLSSSTVNSDYLNIMYLPGSGEVAVFMAAFAGALLGFLWYNCYPAQVFMGDTGSLARHHRRGGNAHAQGTAAAYTLRHFPRGVALGADAEGLFQIHKEEIRRRKAHIPYVAVAPSLPERRHPGHHTDSCQGNAGVQDSRPFLDSGNNTRSRHTGAAETEIKEERCQGL